MRQSQVEKKGKGREKERIYRRKREGEGKATLYFQGALKQVPSNRFSSSLASTSPLSFFMQQHIGLSGYLGTPVRLDNVVIYWSYMSDVASTMKLTF